MARRLAERGVRFIQLMHAGWDQHGSLTTELYNQTRDTDQPSAALLLDLKQRGLLDDTLLIWGGEFGRTPFLQGDINDRPKWGRDHHPYAFTTWMAGGGIKPGISYGESDDLGMNVTQDPVHVHDFQATILHLLGIDHERLTYKHQGRRFRLTDVHGSVVLRNYRIVSSRKCRWDFKNAAIFLSPTTCFSISPRCLALGSSSTISIRTMPNVDPFNGSMQVADTMLSRRPREMTR